MGSSLKRPLLGTNYNRRHSALKTLTASILQPLSKLLPTSRTHYNIIFLRKLLAKAMLPLLTQSIWPPRNLLHKHFTRYRLYKQLYLRLISRVPDSVNRLLARLTYISYSFKSTVNRYRRIFRSYSRYPNYRFRLKKLKGRYLRKTVPALYSCGNYQNSRKSALLPHMYMFRYLKVVKLRSLRFTPQLNLPKFKHSVWHKYRVLRRNKRLHSSAKVVLKNLNSHPKLLFRRLTVKKNRFISTPSLRPNNITVPQPWSLKLNTPLLSLSNSYYWSSSMLTFSTPNRSFVVGLLWNLSSFITTFVRPTLNHISKSPINLQYQTPFTLLRYGVLKGRRQAQPEAPHLSSKVRRVRYSKRKKLYFTKLLRKQNFLIRVRPNQVPHLLKRYVSRSRYRLQTQSPKSNLPQVADFYVLHPRITSYLNTMFVGKEVSGASRPTTRYNFSLKVARSWKISLLQSKISENEKWKQVLFRAKNRPLTAPIRPNKHPSIFTKSLWPLRSLIKTHLKSPLRKLKKVSSLNWGRILNLLPPHQRKEIYIVYRNHFKSRSRKVIRASLLSTNSLNLLLPLFQSQFNTYRTFYQNLTKGMGLLLHNNSPLNYFSPLTKYKLRSKPKQFFQKFKFNNPLQPYNLTFSARRTVLNSRLYPKKFLRKRGFFKFSNFRRTPNLKKFKFYKRRRFRRYLSQLPLQPLNLTSRAKYTHKYTSIYRKSNRLKPYNKSNLYSAPALPQTTLHLLLSRRFGARINSLLSLPQSLKPQPKLRPFRALLRLLTKSSTVVKSLSHHPVYSKAAHIRPQFRFNPTIYRLRKYTKRFGNQYRAHRQLTTKLQNLPYFYKTPLINKKLIYGLGKFPRPSFKNAIAGATLLNLGLAKRALTLPYSPNPSNLLNPNPRLGSLNCATCVGRVRTRLFLYKIWREQKWGCINSGRAYRRLKPCTNSTLRKIKKWRLLTVLLRAPSETLTCSKLALPMHPQTLRPTKSYTNHIPISAVQIPSKVYLTNLAQSMSQYFNSVSARGSQTRPNSRQYTKLFVKPRNRFNKFSFRNKSLFLSFHISKSSPTNKRWERYRYKKKLYDFYYANENAKNQFRKKKYLFFFRLVNRRIVGRKQFKRYRKSTIFKNYAGSILSKFVQTFTSSPNYLSSGWPNLLFTKTTKLSTPNLYYSPVLNFKARYSLYENSNYRVQREVSVRRVRFRPGYQRLWRRARLGFQEYFRLKFLYQKQLTKYLRTYSRFSQNYHYAAHETSARSITMYSALLPDNASFELFLYNKFIYVNGSFLKSPDTSLFKNDFLQLYVSHHYYIYYKWLRNWTARRRAKFKRLVYWKGRAHKYKVIKKRKQKSFYIPNWVYVIKFDFTDVKAYLEVDYFTLSAWLVYDPFIWYYNSPNELVNSKLTVYRLYNWKYIN